MQSSACAGCSGFSRRSASTVGTPTPSLPSSSTTSTRYVAAWAPFADVAATLDELEGAGIGVAVLTNGEPRQQRLKLERTGLADRFDRILTPTEVGAPKPRPEAFTTACTMLGLDLERTAYVGDNLEVDAVGAVGGRPPRHLARSLRE